MNPFIEHTQQQGITYIEHWCFAMGIAYRLLSSVAAFTLHAMFPFIDIERRLDLEATAAFIEERNRWIESTNERLDRDLVPAFEPKQKWSVKQMADFCVRTITLFV